MAKPSCCALRFHYQEVNGTIDAGSDRRRRRKTTRKRGNSVSFVLFLPIGFIAVLVAIVMAFVGMRKDAQKQKNEAKRIFKRMNIIAAVGFVSIALGLFAPSGQNESTEKAVPAKGAEESAVLPAERLAELEKAMLKDYHENFSMTSWYQKELKLAIAKGEQGFYKLGLYTGLTESEESKKIADQLTHPFLGMVNENGAVLQGHVQTIDVFGKEDKLLLSVKNPIVN